MSPNTSTFVRTHEASFRDPSGFLFTMDGEIYRQINLDYRDNYNHLIDSGLYQALSESGLLIPHKEVDTPPPDPSRVYKVIKPEALKFISYPYEWSFSQLKHAALTTLSIQKTALEFGMSLKDSSAYNIQFHHGHPVLIDSLSFEIYNEGVPWIAYRQFCQHFLAPLSLMAYLDVRLSLLLRDFIDGIPLDLTSRLLPTRTRFVFPLLIHIHTHASAQKRVTTSTNQTNRQMSKTQFLGLIDSLENGIKKLDWSPSGTAWGDYYQADHNYTSQALEHKEQIVAQYLDITKPAMVWDLGANTGRFSRVASERGIFTIAFDVDPGVVETNYQDCRAREEENILPLLLDLTNPSPSIGWHHKERNSLIERGPADAVLALALIHHLAIANNVPLDRLASFFAEICNWLIIEFIPKEDSQVQRLLASREDIFTKYDKASFESAFEEEFTIHRAEKIQESHRYLYLMEGK